MKAVWLLEVVVLGLCYEIIKKKKKQPTQLFLNFKSAFKYKQKDV